MFLSLCNLMEIRGFMSTHTKKRKEGRKKWKINLGVLGQLAGVLGSRSEVWIKDDRHGCVSVRCDCVRAGGV